nr:hypothetical protein [Tanacetum cinerariifolium]
MVSKHSRRSSAKKKGNKKPITAKQPKPKPAIEKSSKQAPVPKAKETKETPAKPSLVKPSKMGKVLKIAKEIIDGTEAEAVNALKKFVFVEYPQRSKRLDSFASSEDPTQSCSFQWAPMQQMKVFNHQILWEQERE